MDTLISIISIIGGLIILGIIIMVHELGHYAIGRLCKIKIAEFAIGFGPKIKSWVKNGIKYSIRWIWLGGFTKFYGEDDELNDQDSFNKQPPGRRALAIVAGPVFNIVFAVFFAVIVLVGFGEFAPIVDDVWEGSPAQQAGLEEGDIVLSLNGVEMEFYMELEAAQRQGNEDYVAMTVLRDGEELSFEIPTVYFERIPEANREGRTDEQMVVKRKMAGLSFGMVRNTYGFFESIALSFRWTFSVLKETLLLIFGLFAGKGLENAMGAASIVNQLGLALRHSFEYLLKLCAAINVSLALANLLPLPALDGGRLVFIGIEKVFRKPVPRKVEGMIHFVGFILLFGVMILFLFRDVRGFFGG